MGGERLSLDHSVGNRVFKGTIIIVLVGILAKLAAFLSEAILAAYLGTTFESDAYYMVAGIKDVIYPMLSVGIWNVFLPLYKSHTAKGESELAETLTDKSLSFFTGLSVIVVAVLILLAPAAVSVVAPGFKDETRALCIRLVRIAALNYVPIIASAVYASMLQCHEKFLGSQIREVVSHIPTIIAAVFFYRHFGIEAMAIALIVGGALRLMIELPFVDWGYRYKPDFRFNTPEFALMLRRLPSALISAGVVQLNTLIDKAMASTLPAGTISGLNYGHKLMNVLSGLLSSSIATALYPQMIELIALDKKDELSRLIAKIINIFSLLMLPITLACVLFRTELVSVVFQRGVFDDSSTKLTAGIFALYCLGIFFIACNAVISNIFYSVGDTKTPMLISIVALVLNVALNLVLIRLWGVNGLALATSLSACVTFFVRLWAAKKLVKLDGTVMLITAAKVLFASALACGLPRFLFSLLSFNKYIVLMGSAVIAVGLYAALVNILRVGEFRDLIYLLKRKRHGA